MGRTPDYKAAFSNTLGGFPEYYGAFADNARNWYKRAQEAVPFMNHAIGELLEKSCDVRRGIEPSGRFIDRAAALIKRPLLNSVSRKMKREEGRCALPAPESP